MKKWWWIFWGVIILPSAYAVKVANIYQADVPVISQLGEMKELAAKDGLLQVLIRMSGNPQVGKNPIILEGLKRAGYFVQNYRFLDSSGSSQYVMQFKYEPTDINRLLLDAGIAYWDDDRPLILVFMAITKNEDGPNIIDNEFSNNNFNNMKFASRRYGLPLIFPVMDIDEINQISADDIVMPSLEVLKEIAKRYTPDAILIGDMTEDKTGVVSKWKLIWNNKQWNWKITAKTQKTVLSSLMKQMSETFIDEYGIAKDILN